MKESKMDKGILMNLFSVSRHLAGWAVRGGGLFSLFRCVVCSGNWRVNSSWTDGWAWSDVRLGFFSLLGGDIDSREILFVLRYFDLKDSHARQNTPFKGQSISMRSLWWSVEKEGGMLVFFALIHKPPCTHITAMGEFWNRMYWALSNTEVEGGRSDIDEMIGGVDLFRYLTWRILGRDVLS